MVYLLFFAAVRFQHDVSFEIKYIPFETIDEYSTKVIEFNKWDFLKNILGNIILFIPYGFLGIVFSKLKHFWWMFFYFFIAINVIEFSQYFTKRGFADIDDVMLNTCGALIGFIIYSKYFKV